MRIEVAARQLPTLAFDGSTPPASVKADQILTIREGSGIIHA
jgi:hypothetical protein